MALPSKEVRTAKSDAENNYRRTMPVGLLPNISKFLILFLYPLESAPSNFIDTKIDKRKRILQKFQISGGMGFEYNTKEYGYV